MHENLHSILLWQKLLVALGTFHEVLPIDDTDYPSSLGHSLQSQ